MENLLIFTEKVVNLKAWQLYLGNGIWTLSVGIVLILISKILGLFGLNNETTNKLLSMTAKVSSVDNQRKHHLKRFNTDLSEGFLTAPPQQQNLLGGCAGTRYGCCPDGVKAKRDSMGSNCQSRHPKPKFPQGNGGCRRWNPLVSDCTQTVNCQNDNQLGQGNYYYQQQNQGDVCYNQQQNQDDVCYNQQQNQGDVCYNQQQNQGDVCYNQQGSLCYN
jgi:hypothetical protein